MGITSSKTDSPGRPPVALQHREDRLMDSHLSDELANERILRSIRLFSSNDDEPGVDDVDLLSRVISHSSSRGATAPKGLCISLHTMQLNHLPSGLLRSCSHASLCILDLSNNRLTTSDLKKLMCSKGVCHSLQRLNLRKNRIDSIPPLRCPSLEVLNLSHNPIQRVSPEAFEGVKHLQVLTLNDTQLTRFPASGCSLVHLISLDLFQTNLVELPETIGSLSSLEHLNVANNHLVALPNGICQLRSLKRLWLCNNKLSRSQLSSSSSHDGGGGDGSIGGGGGGGECLVMDDGLPRDLSKLTSLQFLSLRANGLLRCPSGVETLCSLSKLDLSRNRIASLSSIRFPSTLRKLNVYRNDLVDDVCANDRESVGEAQRWLSSLQVYVPAKLCESMGHEDEDDVCGGGDDDVHDDDDDDDDDVHEDENDDDDVHEDDDDDDDDVHNDGVELVEEGQKAPFDLSAASSETLSIALVRSRAIGCVFGQAIGDAMGLATEFLGHMEASFYHGEENPLCYHHFIRDRHRRAFDPCDWTDDTDQLIVLMETLLAGDANGLLDTKDFARRLHYWCKNGFPELGDRVGQGLGSHTLSVISHPEFLSCPEKVALDAWRSSGGSSASNGSLMRCAVLAITSASRGGTPHTTTPFLRIAVDNALRASRATHADPRCGAACVVLVSCVAALISNRYRLRGMAHALSEKEEKEMEEKQMEKEKKEKERDLMSATGDDALPLGEDEWFELMEVILKDAIERGIIVLQEECERLHVPPSTASAHTEELRRYCSATTFEQLRLDAPHSRGYVLKTLGAACTALRQRAAPRSTLETLIMQAGDADTNAAVAGALLGAAYGYDSLPPEWIHPLPHSQWMRDKVHALLDQYEL